MELRDLAYFQMIAEIGHLGRAAERLHRTQPALTKCIRRLEASLGAQLFERSGRGLKLSSVGELLLTRTRTLRDAVDLTAREIADFARGDAGHIRIGSGATTTEYLLPELCRRLISETTNITMDLVIGMNDVLRTQLRAGSLDLVIGPLSEVETEFEVLPALLDEVVVVARKGHPVFARDIKASDLLDYRWVLPARSVAMRQWLDTAFAAQGLGPPTVQLETNSISLLPRLIAESDLLSFISRRNLGEGRAGAPLQEIDLPETTMRRRLGVVWRRGVYLSPAALRLISLIGASASLAEA